MVDIIIPAYNAHSTICRTLNSIAFQNCLDKLNVYIINDASDRDYSEIVSIYKPFFNITELKLEKNRGPGYARQYGIDQTYSDYIIFIDADDVFYTCYAITDLYNFISKKNYDIVLSISLEENNGLVTKQVYHNGNLHGKIYKRSFLETNKIKFNSTYFSEDNGFNQLIMLLNANVGFFNKVTYIYLKNFFSLTSNEKNIKKFIENYIYNMIWSVKEAEKRNYNKNKAAYLLLSTYSYIYYNYMNEIRYDLFIMNELEKYYSKYEKYLSDSEKKDIMKSKFNYLIFSQNMGNFPEITFDQFRKMIRETII